MKINQELINKIIEYIGDVELERPFFFAEEVQIDGYDPQEVYNHVISMIEGEIIDGFFAYDESSPNCGYLVGGLTLDSRYLYNKMKKAQD